MPRRWSSISSEPQVAVPEHLFHYPFLMLDPAENGVFGVGSNGTGSFELVELEVGRKAVLKRRPDAPGYLDEMQFIDLGDNPAAVAAALASKQVDGIYQGNIEQFDIYKAHGRMSTSTQVVTAQTGVARMRIDAEALRQSGSAQGRAPCPPMRRSACRSRIRASARRPSIITSARCIPTTRRSSALGYKPEEAKKLLAEAGFPDGIDVEINCKPDPSWEQAAVEAMAEQWKAGGIRAKINVLPSAKFWEVWDKVPFGFTEWTHRPLGFMVLALAYRTGVPWNEIAYSNKQVRRAAGQGRRHARCRQAPRDPRRTREDHAGRRPDRAASVAVGLCRLRQAREGLPDPSDALHLRRNTGDQAGLIAEPRPIRTREPALAGFFIYPAGA